MKSLLLSMAALTQVFGSRDFLIKRQSVNQLTVGGELQPATLETHYLLIEPLGRKKLFGEAKWSMTRGTPLKWQVNNHKIQVMGPFKKKNLCLYLKKNKKSPFDVKSCDGMFGGTKSMQIGCFGVGKIGKEENAGDETKMIGNLDEVDGDILNNKNYVKFTSENSNTSICKVKSKDTPEAMWWDTDAVADKEAYKGSFRISTMYKGLPGNPNAPLQKYLCVRMKVAAPNVDSKDGNDKIQQSWYEARMCGDSAKAALFKWNRKRLELVYPDHIKIDGKPVCLEMGKVAKMAPFPFKLQKCDRTMDRGNFGCDSNQKGQWFGTAWNVKRMDEFLAAHEKAHDEGKGIAILEEIKEKLDFQFSKLVGGLFPNDDKTANLCSLNKIWTEVIE